MSQCYERQQMMVNEMESRFFAATGAEKVEAALSYLTLIKISGPWFDYSTDIVEEAIKVVQSSEELKASFNGGLEKTVQNARTVLKCRQNFGG